MQGHCTMRTGRRNLGFVLKSNTVLNVILDSELGLNYCSDYVNFFVISSC